MTRTELDALPPLYESVLTDETLDALFTDVGLLPGRIEIALKSAANARATEAPVSLEEARAALRAGTARAVQLRYEHEGVLWSDTLVRLERGVRLVRFPLPTVAP